MAIENITSLIGSPNAVFGSQFVTGAGASVPATINDPTDITGCVLWLDPDDISASDGDPVGAWSDLSGEGNDGSASGADRPDYHDGTDFYHEHPTLKWDNTGERITVAADASLDNGEVTYIIMARCSETDVDPDPLWLMNKVNTNSATVGIRADDTGGTEGQYEVFFRLDGSEGTVRTLSSTGPVREAWTAIVFRYNGSVGELYLDHALSDSLAVSGSIDTDNSDVLAIGNHNSVDVGWAGDIGDVIVYDNAISDDDLTSVVDYLLAKYPNSEYTKTGTAISGTNLRHARVRTASETGLSDNQMLLVTEAGQINHYTSPTSDPHNWTLANSSVITTDAQYRTLDFLVVSGTWYVYVDHAASNGEIELWTGAAVTSLTEHASSPVITGSVGNYTRTPGVIEESGSWTMLIDVRTDSVTGGDGHIDRYTSSDGISWTQDAVNSPVLESTGSGYEATDVGHPCIYKRGTSDYILAYAGYNDNHHKISWFPHEIGLATSTNLIDFTRVSAAPSFTHQEDDTTDLDITSVSNPCLWDDGTNLTLYYSGFDSNIDIEIYYATGNASAGASDLTAGNVVTFAHQADREAAASLTASNTLTFAQTNDISGTVAVTAENTIVFTGTAIAAGPKPVTASDTLSLTQSASSGIIVRTASNTFTLVDSGAFVETYNLTASHTITFAQTSSSGAIDLSASDTITYSQSNIRVRVGTGFDLTATSPVVFTETNNRIHVKLSGDSLTASHSITFYPRALIPIELTGSGTITITDLADRFPNPTVTQTLVLTQTVVLNMVRSRTASDSLVLNHGFTGNQFRDGLPISDSTRCGIRNVYSPFSASDNPAFAMTAPTLTRLNDVIFYYPSGLIGSATDSITLRSPNFGDRDRNQYNRIRRESRGGSLRVYRDTDWPSRRSFVVDFSAIKDSEVINLIAFLETSLGKEIGFRDWLNRTWYGIIVNPDTPVIRQGTDRNDIAIEFEVNQLV